MTTRSLANLFSIRAAGLVVVLGSAGLAGAADPAAPAISAAPVMTGAPVGGPGEFCPTCNGAPSVAGCKSCGKACHGILPHARKPYTPHLCPGACFGYFQTQWHRWEDVCPIPYQGVGQTDAPPRATPGAAAPGLLPQTAAEPKAKGSDQPLPKPTPVPQGAFSIPQVPEKSKP